MPKKVPIKVDMTSPGSKLRYKITYPDGQQKWMKDRPGHKSKRWKLREKKLLLREPAIKQFLGRLEYVVNSYLDGGKEEDDIQRVVRNFETTVGWNRARMVVRRVRRNERRKLMGLEGDEKKRQQEIVDALQIAVDYSARRRRDKKKKARLLAIAENVFRFSQSGSQESETRSRSGRRMNLSGFDSAMSIPDLDWQFSERASMKRNGTSWIDIGPDIEVEGDEWERKQMALREIALSDGLEKIVAKLGRAVKSSKMTRDGLEVAGMNGRFVYVDISGKGVSALVKWEVFENDGARIEGSNAKYNSDWTAKLEKVMSRAFGRIASISGELVKIAKEVMAEEKDQHGVFVWTRDGKYRAEDAVKIFQSKILAQRFADKNSDKNYVVRAILNPLARHELTYFEKQMKV